MTAPVGSTVLVVAIVAVWVVVLLPMFLRGHDRRSELQSADRFARSMRVLSRRRGRRGGLVDTRFDLHPSEARAAAISKAFGGSSGASVASAPRTPSARVRPVTGQARRMSPERRAARVAARRRGLAVLLGAIGLTLLLAVVVGGPMWAVQGLTDVLALAGLAQLRASAIADRYLAVPARVTSRSAARVTEEPVSERRPWPVSKPSPRPTVVDLRDPAPLPVAVGAEHPVAAPVVRGPGKQIVFDAVSETPVVEKPRVRTVAPPVRKREVRVGPPTDFVEMPASPPMPERVQRQRAPYRPLLDPVDTDPETLTEGLEVLDSILGRAANE